MQPSASTSDAEDKIDKFYGQIQSETDRTSTQDVLLVMEDWKDEVGKRLSKNSVGNWNETEESIPVNSITSSLLTQSSHNQNNVYIHWHHTEMKLAHHNEMKLK